jgi:hypothetical protein
MLVKNGATGLTAVVAVFPEPAHLWIWDPRLANTTLLPYWRWQFGVTRRLDHFRYGVVFSIMGSPEEGLKYREKASAHWHRPELEAWAATVLQQFEHETRADWAAYRRPLSTDHEHAFAALLVNWFAASRFAAEGIHVEHVVANLPEPSSC